MEAMSGGKNEKRGHYYQVASKPVGERTTPNNDKNEIGARRRGGAEANGRLLRCDFCLFPTAPAGSSLLQLQLQQSHIPPNEMNAITFSAMRARQS